ncbi:MAG TPA: multiheme c-type cytochrome [Candidatus Sulfotelmatobacter sp.]|nr:multiheme c-type cytochrome [Candidatus Sulfotelmatobacter sp.]
MHLLFDSRARVIAGVAAFFLLACIPLMASTPDCVDCHSKVTPNIVSDWKLSKHSAAEIGCASCHGDQHTSANDVAKVKIPTPETCSQCHETQVTQFKKGKHALAWASMKAMPTIHYQPMAMIEGEKGCGGCHKIGDKSVAEIEELRKNGSGAAFGAAQCDSCHTRHTFSVEEARQPQACETCHMGFDHPQWEMYSASKHGVRHELKQEHVLPADAAAPSCQTCHMQDGNHEVRTAWGFLAVRLPLPEDKQWAADRATVLQALGVLDPQGQPTKLVEVVKAADVARLSQEDWQRERDKMVKTCNQCHSVNFAKQQLALGDDMIKNADHLMAQAIRIIADLYKDGVLPKPANYSYPFPNLLTFHDAPTVIEQKLFVMYLEHRMRTFQGTFHASPDYALWYGWSEMQRDLTEIKELAAQMRREKHEATLKPAVKLKPAVR